MPGSFICACNLGWAGVGVTCFDADECAMGTDGSVPMALDYFAAMGGRRVFAPERVVFALDHYAGDGPTAALHRRVREFAACQGIRVWEVGEGIGHQLIIEHGLATPGSLVVGADSHAVTYGAVNAFSARVRCPDSAPEAQSRSSSGAATDSESKLPSCRGPFAQI